MAKTKYDPLEAAKIGADGEKAKAPIPAFKNEDIDVSDVEEMTPPARPAPTAKPRPRYLVLEAGRASVGGQLCLMAKGAVIDSAGYGGEAGIARLIDQGLKLELVQD